MGRQRQSLAGRVFGRWEVLRFSHVKQYSGRPTSYWMCKCACGKKRPVPGGQLTGGKSKSCGCLQRDGRREKRLQLTGRTFGGWKVIEFLYMKRTTPKGYPKSYYRCRCVCGKEKVLQGARLTQTNSCGCLIRRGTHRLGGSKVYNAWHGMKSRCDNPQATNYSIYGGRGISYDPAWSKFEVFFAEMGNHPPGPRVFSR